MKRCLRETFCYCLQCSCEICKPPPVEKSQYNTSTRQNLTVNRMILIERKYVRYINIHMPSYIQILTNDEKNNFYEKNFLVLWYNFEI
jgi:hypothetical protein